MIQCQTAVRIYDKSAHPQVSSDDQSRCPDNDERILLIEANRWPLANAHYRGRNTKESGVRPYTLPPLWHGKTFSREQWEKVRRPELLKIFTEQIYGAIPPPPDGLEVELLSQQDDALDNLAIRKELRLHCRMNSGKNWNFDVLLYVPRQCPQPAPVWVSLNFYGNQFYTTEPDIRRNRGTTNAPGRWYATAPIPENWRGDKLDFVNARMAVQRGYAVATAANGEIFPDHPYGALKSIYTLFYDAEALEPYPGTATVRPWGAISAWAWGMSRILDALTLDPLVDTAHAAVIGHSRLGKTALWAGANDPRFKLVVSNNSGCMGAALSRRNFGENICSLCNIRDYWFHENFLQYAASAEDLPIDQHQLLSLIAPRALYVGSSTLDDGADPRGEFLSLQAAAPVWKLYDLSPDLPATWPQPEHSVGQAVGYHLKVGKHSLTAVDWQYYYDFADRIFKGAGA